MSAARRGRCCRRTGCAGNLTCERGTVGVFFTLSPTQPPAVQHLEFRKLDSGRLRMGAPTGAPAGVSCVIQ